MVVKDSLRTDLVTSHLKSDKKHRLKQRFDVQRKLGQGTYGKVQLAVNRETGQEMAKGKKLTDHERGQIEALASTGMSSRAIAIKIGRSKTVVNNFLKLKDNYGKKNTGGRPKALSSRDERRVCQLASTGKYSTRKLIPTTVARFDLIKGFPYHLSEWNVHLHCMPRIQQLLMRDLNKALKEGEGNMWGEGKPTSVFMSSNHQANGHSLVSILVPAQALPAMPDAGMTCTEYIINQPAGWLTGRWW
ncbi:Transposable element Tc3 transposase like protein [Argiope bruennichi]|uniref:Transposable element Tc3 transposase like protein n=1 Tax=Argiope bruennichi TaxID=94029 RepID=A0A8T0EBM6_ARGBR|nr:Transposable element Tc3 transposase like protein [Argiope bruennichi]